MTAAGTPAPQVGETITVPRPHVPTGPKDVSADVADADYLRSAVENVKWAVENRRGLWGSGVTEMVVRLLLDAADAIERPDAPQPAPTGDAVERARRAIIGAGMTGGGHIITGPLAHHLARAALAAARAGEPCAVCGRTDGSHKMSCRPQNREDAARYGGAGEAAECLDEHDPEGAGHGTVQCHLPSGHPGEHWSRTEGHRWPAGAGAEVDREALAMLACTVWDQHGPDMHSVWDGDRWRAVVDAVLAARGAAAPTITAEQVRAIAACYARDRWDITVTDEDIDGSIPRIREWLTRAGLSLAPSGEVTP